MGYGWHNPFPFRYGAGPTPTEATWRALRATMGGSDGGVIGPEGGLEDTWRSAKALAITASEQGVEGAARQAFQATATSHLDSWEERTGVDPEATDAERRSALVAEEVRQVRADIPSLEQFLATLSPHLSIYAMARSESSVAMLGMTLDPSGASGVAFRGNGSQWPGYSDAFKVRVVWDHVTTGEAAPPTAIRTAIADHLNATLPGWVDWGIQQAPRTGFYLDGGADGLSLLDATPLGI